MKIITLNNEAKMPIIGLGTFLSSPGEVYKAVRWALKLGYRHIDCASIYGNQNEVGQAIQDAMKEDNIKREDLFITSKLWNDSHQIDDVKPAFEQTLSELKLDYLDLYLIHWPVAQKKGTQMPTSDEDWLPLEEVPLWETYSEMEKLHEQGLCKAIGVSNFNKEHLAKLISKTQIIPAVNQVECHPLLNQNELIDYCSKNNIAVTAYSPLGAQYSHGSLLTNPRIVEIAGKNNVTPAQVLLAWQIARGVIVIPKSVHEDRIRENFASLALSLDNDDIKKIDEMNENHRFITGEAFINKAKGYDKIF